MKYKRKIIILLLVSGAILIFAKPGYDMVEKAIYPLKYDSYVEKYSKEYNIDKYLVYSVIKAESKFRPDAESHKGAKGLMQISDTTAKWAEDEIDIDSGKMFDPETNIKTGCWYLKKLYREFGDTDLVIAAYNGGSGNVRKWLKQKDYSKDGEKLHHMPFEETLNYAEKVKHNYKKYRDIYDGR